MNKLKVGEMAILDNGEEYICVGQMNENKNDYVFLMSNFKPLKIRFAAQTIEENNLQLNIVNDKETKNHLFEIFKDNIN